MATDYYLQIDGLKGESLDSEHADWIEIHSFSHAISQPSSATASSAGGATGGRCKHEDFVVTKYVDLSSPKLYEMCSSGKHISKVLIELMRASGDARVKYMVIEMDEVMISMVAPGASSGGDLPTETVSFNYGKIKWTYTQQKRKDGSKGGNVVGGWSLIENKSAA
jgi:type VI secretion system secreted protein Hcp